MRINNYRVEKDDKKAVLVKESGVNYPKHDNLANPESIYEMLCDIFRADVCAEEHVWLICMDAKTHVIGVFEVSHGSTNNSIVGTREIFTRICLCGASGFVLAHNHPSGDPAPSVEDCQITKKISEASKLMDVQFLDHVIVGEEIFVSMKERCESYFK